MNKAQKLFEEVRPILAEYDIRKSAPKEVEQVLAHGGQSARDIFDREGWLYYQFLACLVSYVKPKQVVELGGAWGTSALMMLSSLPEGSKLYTITLPEEPAYVYIKQDYPNLTIITGDLFELNNWPKNLDLAKTDLWFIDTMHNSEQLRAELKLYTPFFKKGAIILFDDIHFTPEFHQEWLEVPYEKTDVSSLHVPTGFGIAVV